MNTETLKTLEAVQDARLEVEEQRADESLSATERKKLEKLSLLLKNMERTLIKETRDELISKLTADAQKLDNLVEQINKATLKLGELAGKVERAAKTVEALIKIVGIAASAGLL